jgi:hypothetical protein
MPAMISILDPTAVPASGQQQTRRTLDSLQGKVVGFIDNAKTNFNHLVDDMAMVLEKQYGVKSVIKHRKRAATLAVADDVLKDMARQCDVIITGSGD